MRLPQIFPGTVGGMRVIEVSADKQKRTPCDVPLRWVRPRVPSKLNGRKGTRRGWKRKNPPHMIFTYREPQSTLSLAHPGFNRGHGR